jgi:CDP-diglyceride synthetase
MLYVALRAKKKGVNGAYFNNIANSSTLFFSITINLIMVNLFNFSKVQFIVFPFDFSIVVFFIFFLIFFFLLMFREKKFQQRNNDQTSELSFSATSNQLPLKYEIYRKIAHLTIIGIILFYFTIGSWIKDILIDLIAILPETFSDLFYSFFLNGSHNMIFNQYLVIFLVAISLFGLLTADFVRILYPKLYPLKPVNQILRKKELYMRLGPQISMAIGCFSIIILYGLFQPIGPIVISTSMIMSVFGDMAANLIGRIYGKKTIYPLGKRKSNKTFIGLFAGISVSFLSGIVILLILKAYYLFNILGFIILPLTGALLIGLLDYFDLEIDDNLTYPLVLSTVLFFLSFWFI